jgi:hypothetical protein
MLGGDNTAAIGSSSLSDSSESALLELVSKQLVDSERRFGGALTLLCATSLSRELLEMWRSTVKYKNRSNAPKEQLDKY